MGPGPELMFFGTAFAVAAVSFVAARLGRTVARRKFEVEARTHLVRHLDFRSMGSRTLGTHRYGRSVQVTFGAVDLVRGHVRAFQRRRRPRFGAGRPMRGAAGRPILRVRERASAVIEVDCEAKLPVQALGVEICGSSTRQRGRTDLAFALLELPFRAELRAGESVEWRRNRLCVVTAYGRGPVDFSSLVQKTVEIADELEREGHKPTEPRLVDEAIFGRRTEYRVRSLRLLMRFYPSPLTRSALFRLATDKDPVVRLHAARALGSDGVASLHALARSRAVPANVRFQSIEAIADRIREGAAPLLKHLLDDPNVDVAQLSLRHLGAVCGIDALETIREAILRPTAREPLVLAGVDYLERLSFRSASSVLHRLSSHRSERVQIAAVEAIGRLGDPNWLPPLVRRLQHQNVPPALAGAIETAINRIRSRHRTRAGNLSVVAPPGELVGALSSPHAAAAEVGRVQGSNDTE